MNEKSQTNNVPNEAHGQRDCCTTDSSAEAALKANLEMKSGEKSKPDAAQKLAEAGCCCGSKSPKR